MSILPSFIMDQIREEEPARQKDVVREYGVDFDTGTLTGALVEGKDAVKVWIWLALRIERYRYAVFSWQYGVELEQYNGGSYSQEYLNDNIRMDIEDCLKVIPHVTGISNFKCRIEDGVILLSVIVHTDYGEVSVNV